MKCTIGDNDGTGAEGGVGSDEDVAILNVGADGIGVVGSRDVDSGISSEREGPNAKVGGVGIIHDVSGEVYGEA